MNKCIYIRKGQEAIWSRAQTLAGLSRIDISQLIAELLEKYIESHEPCARCGWHLTPDCNFCPACGKAAPKGTHSK